MQKKTSLDLTFEPSALFKTANGFFVRAEVESIDGTSDDRTIVICHAFEPDGYEVVFTAPRKPAIEALGTTIDIPGHAILGYSGALGPWGPARVRQVTES